MIYPLPNSGRGIHYAFLLYAKSIIFGFTKYLVTLVMNSSPPNAVVRKLEYSFHGKVNLSDFVIVLY